MVNEPGRFFQIGGPLTFIAPLASASYVLASANGMHIRVGDRMHQGVPGAPLAHLNSGSRFVVVVKLNLG